MSELIKYFHLNRTNQVIHFTSRFETIKLILESESLRLSYCKEEFHDSIKIRSENVHPMVCFSEYDTLSLPHTINTYGNYGIAFKPEWIVANRISPVIYIDKYSPVAIALTSLIKQRRTLPKGHPMRLPVMTIRAFVKNAVGRNYKREEENFVFRNEQEWRFVPSKDQIGGGYISENRTRFLKNPDIYNDKVSKYPLKFNLITDVVVIYCSNELEIEALNKLYPFLKVELSPWKYLE